MECGLFWIPHKEVKLGELDLARLWVGFSPEWLRATLSCFASPHPLISFGGFHGFGLYSLLQIFSIHALYKPMRLRRVDTA